MNTVTKTTDLMTTWAWISGDKPSTWAKWQIVFWDMAILVLGRHATASRIIACAILT
jgi:hypothetical protein